MKKLLVLILLVFVSHSAFAGITLLKTPQTETLGWKELEFEVTNGLTFEKRQGDAVEIPPNLAVEGTVGLFSAEQIKTEASLTWSEYESADHKVMKGAFKATVLEAGYFPSFSLGVFDYSFQQGKGDNNILFALLSREFNTFGRPTIGYYMGNSQILRDEKNNIVNQGMIISWIKQVPKLDDKLEGLIEWMSGFNPVAALNIGARYKMAASSELSLGYSFPNNRRLAREQVIIKASFNF